jgi:hypothetical protein
MSLLIKMSRSEYVATDVRRVIGFVERFSLSLCNLRSKVEIVKKNRAFLKIELLLMMVSKKIPQGRRVSLVGDGVQVFFRAKDIQPKIVYLIFDKVAGYYLARNGFGFGWAFKKNKAVVLTQEQADFRKEQLIKIKGAMDFSC